MRPAQAARPAALADFGLTTADAERLLNLAEGAIRARLAGTPTPPVDEATLPSALRRPNPAFVTLHVGGRLNGCIGDVGGILPLADSIAELALKSAFGDPRLPALRSTDLPRLSIEISLLSPFSRVPAGTRAELIRRLRPSVHGLVLRSRGRSALFLPSVWEQLPDPDDFVEHLLAKAGLPRDRWPDDMVAELFTTASFERTVA